MQSIAQSIDSVGDVSPSRFPSVHDVLGQAIAAARPSSLVLLVVCIVGLLGVWYLLRAPRDYPFRGAALTFALLGTIGSGGLLVYRMAHIAARALPPVASKARSVVADHLARENVGPLESYVPLMAGERAEPATVTSASTDVRGAWTATVPADPRAIIDYYRSPVHHPGWFLEFDSSTMLVFRRPITALAVRGTERVRVRVETPVVSTVSHPHHDTYVEYVITRRF